MGLIVLEALIALALLAGLVWWTMFAGRHRGEVAPPSLSPPARHLPEASDASGESGQSEQSGPLR